MKRILITGMSGTGKSTVINELTSRGYKAIDTDYDGYSEWVDVQDLAKAPGEPVENGRDWVWNEERMNTLLASDDGGVLFVSGCSPNMGKFIDKFDAIILLSAPTEVIVNRLTNRTNNPYGKQPEEIARVLRLVDTVEPELRRIANEEINTDSPPKTVVEKVINITNETK